MANERYKTWLTIWVAVLIILLGGLLLTQPIAQGRDIGGVLIRVILILAVFSIVPIYQALWVPGGTRITWKRHLLVFLLFGIGMFLVSYDQINGWINGSIASWLGPLLIVGFSVAIMVW